MNPTDVNGGSIFLHTAKCAIEAISDPKELQEAVNLAREKYDEIAAKHWTAITDAINAAVSDGFDVTLWRKDVDEYISLNDKKEYSIDIY